MIVVDTNIVAYHLLRTPPFAEETQRLAERDPEWTAPPLLLSELRNVLTVQHRVQELSIREVKQLLAQAEALFENALINVESEEVVEVVERTSLSAYDCEYVALAHRLGCPFVTYDSDILDQFPTLTYEPTGIPNE